MAKCIYKKKKLKMKDLETLNDYDYLYVQFLESLLLKFHTDDQTKG